jgi:hypothetical protein
MACAKCGCIEMATAVFDGKDGGKNVCTFGVPTNRL